MSYDPELKDEKVSKKEKNIAGAEWRIDITLVIDDEEVIQLRPLRIVDTRWKDVGYLTQGRLKEVRDAFKPPRKKGKK